MEGYRLEIEILDVETIINETVKATISQLREEGLIKGEEYTAYQRTEMILQMYPDLKKSQQPHTKKLIKRVDHALKDLETDKYYEIIRLFYFENKTREYIAEYFNTTTTTISRNKNRLVNRLKVKVFSDMVINGLIKE